MKKTLIALAVLATSGASIAQVAITGAVAMGYQADTTAAGVATGGFGVDTTALTFTATEDIGGGLKAAASLGFDGMNRKAVGGADTSMSLTGGFGRIGFATARGSDYLSGGVAGVAGIGFDGKLFSGLVAADSISYALPAFGPVTVSFAHDEVNVNEATSTAADNTTADIGLGLGGAAATSGVNTKYQRRNGVGIAYSAGALKANAAYQVYDRTETALNSAKNNVNRVRASVSYDLGAAVIGAGFDQRQLNTGTRMDTLVGLSVPMGALSFGVQMGQRTVADATSSNGTQTGTGLKAAYALSKRTNLSYTYVKYDEKVLTASTVATTYQAVLLAHSF